MTPRNPVNERIIKLRHCLWATLPLIISGSAVFGAVVNESPAIPLAPTHQRAQAQQEKQAPPAADAPPTREEILKEGPPALEQNCTACHGPDKWEGTNRNREGWAAVVSEMSRQMAQAQMQMSDKTANLIIDYLALTRPQ